MTVRMKQLPKMARGEGTMAYREDGTIMFRKTVKVSETQTKRVTVYGETVREVMALMAQKEKEALSNTKKQLENAQKFEGSPLEKKMNVLMGQIGIDYSKLTKEEQMTLLRVFNKSSMLKHRTKAGMRGKHRR